MFGKAKAQPAGAIDLAGETTRLGDAREILRVFIPQADDPPIGGIFVDPYEGFTPFMFGIVLADLVHHGAKAYAYKFGADETATLYEISQGLNAELRSPTDTAKQTLPETDS